MSNRKKFSKQFIQEHYSESGEVYKATTVMIKLYISEKREPVYELMR